jgi:DNA-binding response OmpR family regulator
MTPSLLVVEDDDTARVLLTNVLKRAGYHVTAASDGETAIQLLNNAGGTLAEGYPYDVVITDIRMQGLDGIEVMHVAMRNDPPPAVILMTGFSSVETAVAALRAHAFDYLLKPCDTEDLLRCVEGAVHHRNAEIQRTNAIEMLSRGLDQLQGAASPGNRGGQMAERADNEPQVLDRSERFLQVGDLCLDLFRHTMTFQDVSVQLTPIEYELLLCLAETPGRVMKYQEIAYATHGSRVSTNEAQVLLRTHVRNLRKKIDPEYIVNVRGTGYMLVVPGQNGEEG